MQRTGIDGIDLNDPMRFKNMEHHEMFRRLRAEAPIYWQPDDLKGGGYWNVVKHADLIEVNRDTATFSSEIGGTMMMSGQYPIGEDPDMPFDTRGSLMLDMDPPKHTRYRLLVNKGFTPRMIGLIEQALQHRATVIVDNVIENGEADFVEDIAAELPLQAIAEIMGVPQEDRRKLFEWSNRMVGAGDPEYQDNDQQGAFVELFTYSNELAALRREDPRDDIVSKLLGAEIDGEQLSELEFDMFMLLLAVAGNETTRNATAHGMHALLTNPEQFELLKRDPDAHIANTVEEVLRWGSPVLHFRRTTTTPTEIRGQAIDADERVLIWHISANRDEEIWDDPFVFDITRDPNPHVAFGGGGNHFCLGANLARTELRLILEELVQRLPDMQLADEPDRLLSNFIGGIKHMPVKWTPGSRVLAPADA
jgi:cholest-4-en-3-one 26-monooxygenase